MWNFSNIFYVIYSENNGKNQLNEINNIWFCNPSVVVKSVPLNWSDTFGVCDMWSYKFVLVNIDFIALGGAISKSF